MKHLKFILFILVGFTILNLWQSCKKGPEDPFFSIHSRVARVTGDWNITSYKVNNQDSLRKVLDSTAFQGACGNEIDKTIETDHFEWSFDKKGNFQEKLTRDTTITLDIINNTPVCPDASVSDSGTVVTVASWNFTSGVGNLKNKEQLYLIDNNTKEVFLFDIIELRNNEMKLNRITVDQLTSEATLREYILSRIK